MDARYAQTVRQWAAALLITTNFQRQIAILSICCLLCHAAYSEAATFRTPNFIVHAQQPEFAQQVGELAEKYRQELGIMWAGEELPRWSAPCPIYVKVGQIGAGGATTFSFHNGEVFGWKMNIQGTEERILDSVLPHEITHTILACRFRQPLPRWADEGMCTLVEHESERRRQSRILADVMRGGTKIPLQSLLVMTEYPPDMRDVMKLYAQGYSLTDYLVQQGGRETFLKFLGDALRHGGWDQALSAHYGVNSIRSLESKWNNWVVAGSPSLNLPEGEMLALQEPNKQATDAVYRGQSPESGAEAPHPLPEQSAPRFVSVPEPATDNVVSEMSALAKNSDLPSQTVRSRQQLLQPVFTTNAQPDTALQPRDQLQLTRDQIQSPQTPLSSQDQAHPFTGNRQPDLFNR